MKKLLCMILAAVMLFTALPALQTSAAEPMHTGSVLLKCDQTEARKMLPMINAFRTGPDAWEWSQDDQTQIYHENLPELTYDYTLEKIAMQRAAEIAISFSHTRPNGERCFSLVIDGQQSWAENIAAGYTSAAAVFEGWKEAEEPYAGQGHRRNMLDEQRLHIGIGHVVMDGVHFWVQEFGFENSGTPATAPENGWKDFPIEILDSRLPLASNALSAEPLNLKQGQSVPAPAVYARFHSDVYPSHFSTLKLQPVWTAADPAMLTVSGGTVTALQPGDTTMTATVGKQSVRIPVHAEPAEVPLNIAVLGANMTLGNELRMNFFVKKSDVKDTAGLSIQITKTFGDNREPVVVEIPAADWESYNANYMVTFDDISAKEMTDEIRVAVLKDGEPAGPVYTDSVDRYALRVLRGEKTKPQLKTVVVDMLNYGAEAQKHFAYSTGNLANGELTDGERALATPTVTVEDHRVRGANYYGANLNLGTNLTLTVYFEQLTPDMHAVISYTKHNREAKELTVSSQDFVKYNSKVSGVRVSTLVVADARQPVTVRIYDAQGREVGYGVDSVESYVARSSSVGELGQAIMKFAESARIYFANR